MRYSGKFKGKRRIRGGRGNVRTMLYMATPCAIECNCAIQTFYRR
ncbi:MAG: transposase [Gammaproteobacteria bacterium]|nr:transposase [Gammaproteobacteria bacterium]